MAQTERLFRAKCLYLGCGWQGPDSLSEALAEEEGGGHEVAMGRVLPRSQQHLTTVHAVDHLDSARTDTTLQNGTGTPHPAPQPRKRRKSNSRQARWDAAVEKARGELDKLLAARDDLVAAITELKDIQTEFEEWKDNLPENLSQSALGEKLEAVCGIDLEPSETDIDAMDTAVSEAEAADLPRGFGRD